MQAERAAVAAAAKDHGRLAEARCPMLARHLRAERVAVDAANTEQTHRQATSCDRTTLGGASVQHGDAVALVAPAVASRSPGVCQEVLASNLAALAARLRAAPRDERRTLLEALPKATRRALELHILAERAAT